MNTTNLQLYDLSAIPLVYVSAEFMHFSGVEWVRHTEQLLAIKRSFTLIYPELHVTQEKGESQKNEDEDAREARTIIAKWLRKHRDEFSACCKAIILCSSKKECADNLMHGLERMYGVPVMESTADQVTLLAKEIMSIN